MNPIQNYGFTYVSITSTINPNRYIQNNAGTVPHQQVIINHQQPQLFQTQTPMSFRPLQQSRFPILYNVNNTPNILSQPITMVNNNVPMMNPLIPQNYVLNYNNKQTSNIHQNDLPNTTEFTLTDSTNNDASNNQDLVSESNVLSITDKKCLQINSFPSKLSKEIQEYDSVLSLNTDMDITESSQDESIITSIGLTTKKTINKDLTSIECLSSKNIKTAYKDIAPEEKTKKIAAEKECNIESDIDAYYKLLEESESEKKIRDSIPQLSKGTMKAKLKKSLKKKKQSLSSEDFSQRKKRKTSKSKLKKVNLLDFYYQKLEIPDDSVSAKKGLRKLHDEFEALCKEVRKVPEIKDTINQIIQFNDPEKEVSCQCPKEVKNKGILHNVFPSEKMIDRCQELTNNSDLLYHYKVVIEPDFNFKTKTPTTIYHDGKEFVFEGFSVFTHSSFDKVLPYTFKRNLFEYEVILQRQKTFPQTFCMKDLDLISTYLFHDICELYDWKFVEDKGCPVLHFMPRFVCLTDSKNNKEESTLLSMAELMKYLIESNTPFYENMPDWNAFKLSNKGSVVICQNKQPRAIRCDKIPDENEVPPVFVHSTTTAYETIQVIKEHRKKLEELQHLDKHMKGRDSPLDKQKSQLLKLQTELDKLKESRREIVLRDVYISTEGYYHTGLRWDIPQHISYLEGLWKHVKVMLCFNELQNNIGYQFKDLSLLKAAITLPSFHGCPSMSSCTAKSVRNLGKKIPEININKQDVETSTRKKGMMSLVSVMAKGVDAEQPKSRCMHNERLEFLGDAVLDYLASLHLFLMFPDKGAGRLTQFRSGIVMAKNLAEIAKKVHLDDFLLTGHDFYVDDLKNNKRLEDRIEQHICDSLEALIGAVYLDGGLAEVDVLLSNILFPKEESLSKVWQNPKKHPLQLEDPNGDREMINKSETLQRMAELEKLIGVQFKNIRLLARAFTPSLCCLKEASIIGTDYNRLEFFGDAILKFICSDYLYKHFPEHQEGHLTLLRTSLVNGKILQTALTDLGLNDFINFSSEKAKLVAKDKIFADVFEAFLGALHIDRGTKGVRYCQKILEISLFSKLKDVILHQEWVDPKTILQECCSYLREEDWNTEVIPEYRIVDTKVIDGKKLYKVSVCVVGEKKGVGIGRTLKEAEKEAAKDALKSSDFEKHAAKKLMKTNSGEKLEAVTVDSPSVNMVSVKLQKDETNCNRRNDNCKDNDSNATQTFQRVSEDQVVNRTKFPVDAIIFKSRSRKLGEIHKEKNEHSKTIQVLDLYPWGSK